MLVKKVPVNFSSTIFFKKIFLPCWPALVPQMTGGVNWVPDTEKLSVLQSPTAPPRNPGAPLVFMGSN